MLLRLAPAFAGRPQRQVGEARVWAERAGATRAMEALKKQKGDKAMLKRLTEALEKAQGEEKEEEAEEKKADGDEKKADGEEKKEEEKKEAKEKAAWLLEWPSGEIPARAWTLELRSLEDLAGPLRARPGRRQQPGDSTGKRRHIRRRHQHAPLPVRDNLAIAANRGGHHGPCRSARFQ